MKLRFSCADFTFPLLTHEQSLALIALLGFDAVDLGVFEDRSHQFPSRIAKDPLRAADTMRQSLERHGLRASDVFVQTGAEPPIASANDPDPAVRQLAGSMFDAMVGYASALGCGHITGLPGVRHEGVAPEQDWQHAVDAAKRRVQAAQKAGIVYAVEAHVGSITPDPDTALRLLHDVPGLTLTLDYGHFVYQGMPSSAGDVLVPHASHVHARGGAPGQLQSTVQDNRIDFSAIVRGLREVDYAGYLCVEYVYVDWEGCNRTDNVSETLLLRELLSGCV